MAYARIKGKRVDFSAGTWIVVTKDGKSVDFGRGITGLDWSIKRSAKHQYGSGINPLGQNEGQAGYSATVKVKWEEWEDAREQIGPGYLLKRMDMAMIWKQRMDRGFREGRVEILGFTITDESETAAADGTPEYTLTLLPDAIIPNGTDPIGEG